MPVRKASRQKKKKMEKPWVSKAILVSISVNISYLKHFWSSDPRKLQEYKVYSNKLCKIIRVVL